MALLRGSKGHEADLVLLPVVDIRKLVRRPVLTPTHCGVTVEDQGGMGLAVPHDRFRRFNFRKVRKPVRHDASPTARALPALELIQGSPGITVDRTMHLEQQGLTTDQLERRIDDHAAKLITAGRLREHPESVLELQARIKPHEERDALRELQVEALRDLATRSGNRARLTSSTASSARRGDTVRECTWFRPSDSPQDHHSPPCTGTESASLDRDLAEGDQTEGDQTERDQTEGDQTEGA